MPSFIPSLPISNAVAKVATATATATAARGGNSEDDGTQNDDGLTTMAPKKYNAECDFETQSFKS
ncbi:unnamed protein product [Ilex paraguariensis]|uniref:Uncharacterized protein n=1 Tax=Ilex paraguariensis TaxID=185542 RepID=A0ABC8QLV8_9AQUA